YRGADTAPAVGHQPAPRAGHPSKCGVLAVLEGSEVPAKQAATTTGGLHRAGADRGAESGGAPSGGVRAFQTRCATHRAAKTTRSKACPADGYATVNCSRHSQDSGATAGAAEDAGC